MARLEAIQTLTQLEAFEPAPYLDGIRGALPDALTLEALDEADRVLREALGAIDRFAATAMRILLDGALLHDGSVPPPLRRTLAATVLQYEDDLDTLRQRVINVAARTDPHGARGTADAIADAAARVLALRATLRDGLFAIARADATARLPSARKAAWDRSQDEATQARWAAAVAAMEQFLGEPHEEPPAPHEPTRGELLEFD